MRNQGTGMARRLATNVVYTGGRVTARSGKRTDRKEREVKREV
jgi:hypothetical protein